MEVAINRTIRDMKMRGLISEEYSGDVRFHLQLLCVAVYEQTRREFQTRHTEKIEQFTLDGKKIGEFDSIREAAQAAGYGKRYRGGDYIILNVLAGRHPHSKEGHVWKYAETKQTA